MSRGVCRVDMAKKMSVYTISSPRIARTEVPFSVSCQLPISPLA